MGNIITGLKHKKKIPNVTEQDTDDEILDLSKFKKCPRDNDSISTNTIFSRDSISH